jgi:hypothetical protein
MKKALALTLLALMTVLAFWKVIFHREFTLLTGGDTATAYFPWFDVAAFWLKRGVLMLWDPYVYAGKPFMGEPQPGSFYPVNWLFLLLPAAGGGMSLDGMQALFILHYLLASFFFYLLARSFGLGFWGSVLAGVSWAFGGFMAAIYGYANVLGGFTWMPLVFLFYRRALRAPGLGPKLRLTVLAGCFLAFCFLPGHHIPPVHTGLLLFFYTAFVLVTSWRDSNWRDRGAAAVCLLLVALVAALLTAFQWLPSAEWARQVYRWVAGADVVKWGEKVPYSALEGAANLSPQDAISLLLPYISTNVNLYTGFLVVYLALTGALFSEKRESGFFTFGAILYFLLSWGRFSALHGWVNTFIPGVWFAREVFYYLVPFQACLAMLAGMGLERLVESESPDGDARLNVFLRRSGWVIALLVVASFGTMAVLHLVRGEPLNHPYIQGTASLAVYAALTALLLFLRHTGRMSAPVFRVVLLAAVVVDLTSHMSDDIRPKVPRAGQDSTYVRDVWRKPPAAEFLSETRKSEIFRVDDPDSVFPPNFGDAWRLDSTMGHGATALVRYFEFRGTGWGPATNATALLNARYIVSRTETAGLRKVFGDREAVYVNPRAVPRAFVAQRYRTFETEGELLGWIPTPMLAPAETALFSTAELAGLPADFLRTAVNEDEGITARVLSYERDSEKRARLATDDDTRRRLTVLHPAWGRTAGDGLSIGVRPSSPLEHCYLALRYFAESSGPSTLRFLRKTGEVESVVEVEVPGLSPGESPEVLKRAVVDLGPMDTQEHRVSYVRGDVCRAAIDSLRVTRNPEPAAEVGRVRIISHRPNRIRLHAEMNRPGFVVLSEVYYPGWEAIVDLKPVPLLRADYVLRAIPVPVGSHEIQMQFRPKALEWGLAIAGLSLAAVCWIGLRWRS